MKKYFLILVLLITIGFSVFAQDKGISEENKTNLTYINVPIYKTYDQRQAYIVHYQKNGSKIGQVLIPKQWFKQNAEKKAVLRILPRFLSPYLTVIYKDGNFYRALLNMPSNRNDSHWGVIVPDLDLTKKMNLETLEISY